MTEKRRDWCRQLAESLERCSNPELPCAGCTYDHLCDQQNEPGIDIMKEAANIIRELLNETVCLSTVIGHHKEKPENCLEKAEGSEPEHNDKGEQWQIGLYERAITKWGEELQITKAIEELSELSTVLARALIAGGVRDEHLLANIREELADVEIMCDQMELIFGDVSDWAIHKLERLEWRLKITRDGVK